ncbi:thiopurine S-methyltransferase [Haliangium ochraceum]|uniref:thiopurine S-methyltransferase n=1 Tax=Haliangium ochraceum (strain DSM 14365 / JCM 11303 / SMP-2) TaxID=502025 RepID=D0LKG1_HALO1|nr:thiopurine S-methyltransferase [Haliangium ochraceum]ACY15009.1 Thiopurine S-methyltransferase [Haliangium ochraceum DSM 14365]
MEAQFWIDSWREGGSKTSFHRRDIHPYVLRHLPPSHLRGKRVLVPLCGKTLDMGYFREHAAHVVGVELIEPAIHQFFSEQQLHYSREDQGPFVYFRAERLTLICGDFLRLTTDELGSIDLLYDRAALVALPLHMRLAYVEQVNALLPAGAQQFINTIEYEPSLNQAPFSVSAEDVSRYYGRDFTIEHVESPEVPEHGMVRKFQLGFLREHGFLLSKR